MSFVEGENIAACIPMACVPKVAKTSLRFSHLMLFMMCLNMLMMMEFSRIFFGVKQRSRYNTVRDVFIFTIRRFNVK